MGDSDRPPDHAPDELDAIAHRKRRRVFVEDTRGEGRHLRATWHAERHTFVVSTWIGDVCTGAVRLPASEAPELVGLLVDGLGEMAPDAAAEPPSPSVGAGATSPRASQPPPAPVLAPPAPPDSPAAALAVLRRWLGNRIAGAPQPGRPARPAARAPRPSTPPPAPPASDGPPADEDRRTA